jgi:hypothetical protein
MAAVHPATPVVKLLIRSARHRQPTRRGAPVKSPVLDGECSQLHSNQAAAG